MDNYICVDGVKFLLNDSQISELRAILEKRETKKNPFFERQSHGDEYYYINTSGELSNASEVGDSFDLVRYNNANYCANEELLKQRALEEILARRLWRYSMEHGGDKFDWSNSQQNKFVIYCSGSNGLFYITTHAVSQTINTTYFVDYETAMNAIKEVIEPFMKEYPDFKSYRTSSAQLEGRTIC